MRWYWTHGRQVAHAAKELYNRGTGRGVETHCGRHFPVDGGIWFNKPVPANPRLTAWELVKGYRTRYGHALTVGPCLQCCKALAKDAAVDEQTAAHLEELRQRVERDWPVRGEAWEAWEAWRAECRRIVTERKERR